MPLSWIKKVDFIGKEVLQEQINNGTDRKLVGLEMIDRGIPRHGYSVLSGDEVIGQITSGTQAPTLKKNIGLALIQTNFAEVGTEVEVQVRKRKLKAIIIETPFLKRK